MNTLAGLAREPNETLRAGQRRNVVAPDRMRSRIARHTQMLALVQTILIFGVKRGAAPDHLKDVAHALVILNQQRACRGAHEHFDPRATR
jgi:hypothetical protein